MATISNFATNVVVPSPLVLRATTKAIVTEAVDGGHVLQHGFTAQAARGAIEVILGGTSGRTASSEQGGTAAARLSAPPSFDPRIQEQCTSPQILSAFPRGVDIAMVEHLIVQSNMKAKQLLLQSEEASYAQGSGFLGGGAHDHNNSSSSSNSSKTQLTSMREVCYVAIHAKLGVLQPFVPHWANAIALETRLENAPHALYNLSEFCDEVNYYGERAEARRLRAEVAEREAPIWGQEVVPAVSSTAMLGGVVPLNSNPQSGGIAWYWNRAKVAPLYGSTILHMMGDSSPGYGDSYKFLRWSVNQAF